MERSREGQPIPRETKDVEAVAYAILKEYEAETQEALFELLEELKKAQPSEEVAKHFSDWSHKERIDLQDALFWKLSKKDREAYQRFVRSKK